MMNNEATKVLKGRARLLHMRYPNKTPFQNGDFAILSAELTAVSAGVPLDQDQLTFKGHPYFANIGKEYEFEAELVHDAKYGWQYNIVLWVERYQLETPEEQEAFLISLAHSERQKEALKKIGDLNALLEMTPEECKRITRLSISETRRIVREAVEKVLYQKAYSQLGSMGVPADTIAMLISAYKGNIDKLLDDFEKDPYILITTVRGIGWIKGDKIAQQRGIGWLDPRRIEAYIQWFLRQQAEEGHTYCFPADIFSSAEINLKSPEGILFKDAELFRACIYSLHEKNVLWWDEGHTILALQKLRGLEEHIADELKRLLDAPCSMPISLEEHMSDLRALEAKQGWSFTAEQLQAIQNVTNNNVAIITGAAGTGKSSVVSAIMRLLPDRRFVQCALSGRAAARLSEVTGIPGKTIHRLLFQREEKGPIECDVCIVDEISMVGAEIFYDLLEALPSGVKLIMLGDDGQLESIGLCNIFRDMLDSDMLPIGRLTKIHRQAARSAIITESMKVRTGVQLCEPGKNLHEIRGELQDLEMDVFTSRAISLTRSLLLQHYEELLQEGVPPSDIQIVVPMRSRGDACVHELNEAVHRLLFPMPPTGALSTGEYDLYVGDRVICVKNNYETYKADGDEDKCPIYNGDRGVVKTIKGSGVVITFDLWGDVLVPYSFLKYIELGYALTCHKLQGSEAPYILIGFDFSSYVLLTREWLYTAITRASKYCVLCAEAGAIRYAVSTSRVPFKRTFLKRFLQEKLKEE